MTDLELQKEIQASRVELAKISVSLAHIQKDVAEIKHDMEHKYVTQKEFRPFRDQFVPRAEFTPTKLLIYGLVAVALTAVATAVISAVVVP